MTSSFAEASEWVKDESLPISAIYLNPTDINFSALQFLGETLWARPATPIYILDEAGDFSDNSFSANPENFKILGHFGSGASTFELFEPFRVDMPENLRTLNHRFYIESDHPGYIAVPLIDFIYAKKYTADIFIEGKNHELRLFAVGGHDVDLDYLSLLAKKTAWVYIPESVIEGRLKAFRELEVDYLDPSHLSPSWRTAEALFRAKRLLSAFQGSDVSDVLLDQAYVVLEDLFKLAGQVSQDLKINRLIDQAKRCNRAIAAVTLSVLLCKKMKYTASSTITKTLGFASLLQDISLYRTPYGDLSEKNPKEFSDLEFSYYIDHPNLSANMLRPLGTIPELALQVIRQQHERHDRSGFPKRVGGLQLHPLSEILSLINAYLDPHGEVDFCDHYSEDVVVHFRELFLDATQNFVNL